MSKSYLSYLMLALATTFLLVTDVSADSPFQSSLKCIETINVVLGEDCKAVLNPTLLSEANGRPLIIKVVDANGIQIDTMGIEHVGQKLKYSALDTASNSECWGNLNLELKRIPDFTSVVTRVMCGVDYSTLGLRSIADIELTLDDRCILNVIDLKEEFEQIGDRCDTLVTIRKIVGIVELEDLPRKVTLQIDTILEAPLTNAMITCPDGRTIEEAIFVDCASYDGTAPTPDEIAAMHGDTAAYPFVDKGYISKRSITPRDTIITTTTQELIYIDDLWVSADITTKDTTTILDTTYTRTRVVLPIKPGETCNMSAIYTDEFFDGCVGPNTKIWRKWSILNWCTGAETKCEQWIIINDKEGPEITGLRDTTLSIDPWKCFVSLPLTPTVTESCGGYRFNWSSTAGVIVGDSLITAINLTDGPTYVYLRAVDDCNNITLDTFMITPVDDVAPIVSTTDRINVTLTGRELDGFAAIYVESIDAGSTDTGCGEITRCILLDEELKNPIINEKTGEQLRDIYGNLLYHAAQCKVDGTLQYIESIVKSDTTFTYVDYVICKEVVKLCCTNLGENNVAMVVDDMSPLSPTTYGWTTVNIEDKLEPIVTCPDPITIDCKVRDFYIPRPTISGSVCTDDLLEYTLEEELNTCGEGHYNVIWTLDGKVVCTSIINVVAYKPFDPYTIKWPRHFNDDFEIGVRRECEVIEQDTADYDVYGIVERPENIAMGSSLDCGGDILVEPVWCDGPCGQILSSYEDQVVESADACKKIVRRWTLIDWCTWRPNTIDGLDAGDKFQAVNDAWLPEDSPCQDCDSKEHEDVYFRYTKVDRDGHYDYVQVIKILDKVDPEITVIDELTVNVINGADTKDDNSPCSDSEMVTATVSDMCGDLALDPSSINWVIEVFNAEGNRVAGPKNVKGEEATMTTGEGAPEDVHTIVWLATDDCGNRGRAETRVTFIDNKNPVAVCIQTISTAAMNTDGSAAIWAEDYDLGSFDNCGDVEIYFKDTTGNKVPSMTFTCADIPNGASVVQDLQVFFSDQYGNESYCYARLRIDDNADLCPNIDVDEAMIAGAIQTEIGDKVENAIVRVEGKGIAAVTRVEGTYVFQQLATSDTYDISAERTDAPLNGVSTLDLVIMQQHILGIRTLDSPYKVIAADINSDSRVSAVDLVQLRSVLLGRVAEFPNNDSWRFVDLKQSFEKPLSPFPFTEVITIDPLQSNRMEEDFIGVKIGDVSGNVIANSLIAEGGRSLKTLELQIEDKRIEAGVVNIPIRAKNFADMTGYQMTFDMKDVKILSVESGAINMEASHAILDDQTLTVAWYSPIPITSDDILFTIVVDAQQTVNLNEIIELSSRVTPAVGYLSDDAPMKIEISWLKNNGVQFELLQNTPNPWEGQTTLSFTLPEAGETNVRVIGLTGRVAWEMTENLSAGEHHYSITKDDLGASGVWYYEVRSGEHFGSRKMILID